MQYYIFNKPYSKEEYFKKLKEFNLDSFEYLQNNKIKIKQLWNNFPNKFIEGRKNTNVTGNYINNSKNASNCYFLNEGEDLKYCAFMLNPPVKDCYDYSIFGNNAELVYESIVTGEGSSRVKFCFACWPSCRELEYSILCPSSSNLFGCVGLRHKEYCILNKQYTKEEYEKLVSKIIEQMNLMLYVDKKGRVYRYGEFFPPELSPFCYNETIAQEYFPLTKEQAIEKGYQWKEPEIRNIKIQISNDKLPDNIKDVDDSIINKIIECANVRSVEDSLQQAEFSQCTTAFKIIAPELEFYRKMNLPLPRLCPNCRHYQRIKQRNPLKLW
ncbi:hypothetical protein HY750_01010, partial [Candidatus Kuenenbacteria bacterium]|nr:hypothetical protein [Candidatus Kuenenbacteria bacterium]